MHAMREGRGGELGWAAALVTLGLAARALVTVPNFQPVAAIALIAGLTLRSRILAALCPLAVLWVSDAWLPAYDGWLRLAVYLSVAGSVGIGRLAGGAATPPNVAFPPAVGRPGWPRAGLRRCSFSWPVTRSGGGRRRCRLCAISADCSTAMSRRSPSSGIRSRPTWRSASVCWASRGFGNRGATAVARRRELAAARS